MLPLPDSFNFFVTCKTIHAFTKLSRNCLFMCKKHRFQCLMRSAMLQLSESFNLSVSLLFHMLKLK
jgi:hypothetical protein